MAISEATKDKIRSFIMHRPGEYMLPNDIAKMFHVTAPTVKAQFHFVAATNGGHTDAIRRKGMAYIPMKKEPTVEETMQKSIDDAVEAFSKSQEKERLNEAIAEAILLGDCEQHPKEQIDISTSDGWTIQEAADYFGVSHEAVRNRIKRGELKSYKVVNGDRVEYRIKPEAIEEFEKNHKFRKYNPQAKKVKKEDNTSMKLGDFSLSNSNEKINEKLGEKMSAAIESTDNPLEYKLNELLRENLVLRTKVAIYERLIFGKENTDGVL